jgi:hypothetical protein
MANGKRQISNGSRRLFATCSLLLFFSSPIRWGRPPRGLKRKPESVRKQEGNRNVISLSRFLWLEQWRGRQRWRPQPRSPWEQWILRKRAFWAGACHPRFLVRLLETIKCRNSSGGAEPPPFRSTLQHFFISLKKRFGHRLSGCLAGQAELGDRGTRWEAVAGGLGAASARVVRKTGRRSPGV